MLHYNFLADSIYKKFQVNAEPNKWSKLKRTTVHVKNILSFFGAIDNELEKRERQGSCFSKVGTGGFLECQGSFDI